MPLPLARMRLLQCAPGQHRGEMLAVACRRVNVVDGFELAAALAGIAEKLGARRLSGDRLLEFPGTGRGRAHSSDGDRGSRDLAARVDLHQDRSRGDREIAVAAREIYEGARMIGCPAREAHGGDHLVWPASRGPVRHWG